MLVSARSTLFYLAFQLSLWRDSVLCEYVIEGRRLLNALLLGFIGSGISALFNVFFLFRTSRDLEEGASSPSLPW